MTTLKWPDVLVWLKDNPGRVVRCDQVPEAEYVFADNAYRVIERDGCRYLCGGLSILLTEFNCTFTALPAEDEALPKELSAELNKHYGCSQSLVKSETAVFAALLREVDKRIKQANKGK